MYSHPWLLLEFVLTHFCTTVLQFCHIISLKNILTRNSNSLCKNSANELPFLRRRKFAIHVLKNLYQDIVEFNLSMFVDPLIKMRVHHNKEN